MKTLKRKSFFFLFIAVLTFNSKNLQAGNDSVASIFLTDSESVQNYKLLVPAIVRVSESRIVIQIGYIPFLLLKQQKTLKIKLTSQVLLINI